MFGGGRGRGITEPEGRADSGGEAGGEDIAVARVGGGGVGVGVEAELAEEIGEVEKQRDFAVAGDGEGLAETNGEGEFVGGEVEGKAAGRGKG